MPPHHDPDAAPLALARLVQQEVGEPWPRALRSLVVGAGARLVVRPRALLRLASAAAAAATSLVLDGELRGGLWLDAEPAALAKEAKGFVAAGFGAMKMRIGRASEGEDVARVAAVREAIGPDIELMVDANQGLDRARAIALGRRLEPLGIAWFEEPVPTYDYEGSAAVTAALEVPVASGETEYTRYGFRDLIGAKAARILMPDLQRVGGVSELLRVAQMGQAEGMMVSPHLFMEHMPWFSPLFRESITIENGTVAVSRRPGLGFTFDPNAIARYRLDGS